MCAQYDRDKTTDFMPDFIAIKTIIVSSFNGRVGLLLPPAAGIISE
jgi:hypothetical protein